MDQTREQRLAMLDWQSTELPLTVQADILSLNRSSLYYKPVPPSPEEIRIKHRIDEIYTQYPFLGSRRITAILNREEVKVHRNTVQKYMQEMGLAAIYPGPNLEQAQFAASHLSLFAARADDRPCEPGVGDRHHVYPAAERLDVSGSDLGLVLAIRDRLAVGSEPGTALCSGGCKSCAERLPARNYEQ